MSLTKEQIESAERHPLSAAWGEVPSKLYELMRSDIDVNGLVHKEILYTTAADGKVQVLDGWHRHLICIETGKQPKYKKAHGNPADHAIALNGLRRSLPDSCLLYTSPSPRD